MVVIGGATGVNLWGAVTTADLCKFIKLLRSIIKNMDINQPNAGLHKLTANKHQLWWFVRSLLWFGSWSSMDDVMIET